MRCRRETPRERIREAKEGRTSARRSAGPVVVVAVALGAVLAHGENGDSAFPSNGWSQSEPSQGGLGDSGGGATPRTQESGIGGDATWECFLCTMQSRVPHGIPPPESRGRARKKYGLVWLGRNAGHNFRKPDFATTRKDVPPPSPISRWGVGDRSEGWTNHLIANQSSAPPPSPLPAPSAPMEEEEEE